MTIKDIARESGYSVGTVSRALNDEPGVSAKTKAAIMEVVDKYQFKLNDNARHLKKRSKDGIAIIIKGMDNLFLASLLQQIQTRIEQRNHPCMVYYLNEDDDEVEMAKQISRERQPVGILFLGSNANFFKEKFMGITVPCALVTTSAKELHYDNLSSVCTDDVAAARYAIEFLLEKGHRQIGILSGKMDSSDAAMYRFEGCKATFEEYGVSFDPRRQMESAWFSMTDGYYAMDRLLSKYKELTAVFAMSDLMAIGAIRAIRDHGLRVPEDVSVMGFDGIEIGNFISPRLTTIRQHRERIAERSVDILLECVDNGAQAVHEIEPYYLVPGESVSQVKERIGV
jgi:LacI family transcriptional regulator